MTIPLWICFGYLLGAIPFPVWLGRVFRATDIRSVGDGNPGAMNAWKAGGWQVGLPALLLDYLKGLLPVGLAHFRYGIEGWELAFVALAPIVGHASPVFLGFRGGKTLAVTFGVWTGLTLGEAPLILGLFFLLFVLLLGVGGWPVILGMLGLLAHLMLRQAQAVLIAFWVGNMLILLVKHRLDLRRPPRPRDTLLNRLRWPT